MTTGANGKADKFRELAARSGTRAHGAVWGDWAGWSSAAISASRSSASRFHRRTGSSGW